MASSAPRTIPNGSSNHHWPGPKIRMPMPVITAVVPTSAPIM